MKKRFFIICAAFATFGCSGPTVVSKLDPENEPNVVANLRSGKGMIQVDVVSICDRGNRLYIAFGNSNRGPAMVMIPNSSDCGENK